MKKKNDVEVLIDGRKYTLCGFESPEYIQKIASYINRKLAEFHKQEGYARLDLDLRNTLLAINIADDYYKEKKKASEYRTETQLKDKMVLDMKHEIIELQDTSLLLDRNASAALVPVLLLKIRVSMNWKRHLCMLICTIKKYI